MGSQGRGTRNGQHPAGESEFGLQNRSKAEIKSMNDDIEIYHWVQECSGLVVLARFQGRTEWMRASSLPLSQDEIEELIVRGAEQK